MTRETLERIVREWQSRLNIPHWRIIIAWDKPVDPDDSYAQISRDGELFEGAKLQFASNFEGWSLQEANEIVAHELMHVVTFDMDAAVASAGEVLSGPAYKLLDHRYKHELEGVVDRLALLLVQFAGTFNPAREETT